MPSSPSTFPDYPRSRLAVSHLLEIDSPPDTLAYLLRQSAPDAWKWSLRRLGRFQSVSLSGEKGPGLHAVSLECELFDANSARAAQIYRNAFLGANSLRVLRVAGEPCRPILLETFSPEIIFVDRTAMLPPGFKAFGALDFQGDWIAGYATAKAGATFESLYSDAVCVAGRHVTASQVSVGVKELILWEGFHKIERHDDSGSIWSWTGAARTASFFLPRIRGDRVKIKIDLLGSFGRALQDVRLLIDGMPANLEIADESCIVAEADNSGAEPAMQVSIVHGSLKETDDGSRELGIAVGRVSVESQ